MTVSTVAGVSVAGVPVAVPRSASAQRVLDAALALFAEHGVDGTSLQQIADRLGVTKAAVYYHFRTKDDLIVALIGPAFDELDGVLASAEALSPGAHRQKVAVSSYLEYLLRHRATATWLNGDISAVARPVVWQRAKAVEQRLAALLSDDDDQPLAAFWTSAIARALNGAVLSQPNADEQWLRDQLSQLGSALLTGYRAARRRQS